MTSLKNHVVIHGPIDTTKFSPNLGIVDLPLHVAKSCRYGDAILSGVGEHSISLIGPKVDGVRVQLYVFKNRMYCPFPLEGAHKGLWLCPSGVTNIEKYQGKYYSDIYNEFEIDGVVISPRSPGLTWGEIMEDDMYDGYIFHYLGVQYKVKKEKTYDLLAKEDGFYDSSQRVFRREFKQKSSLGKIFECRAIFDFETKGEFPKFEVIRPRLDKTSPEAFSPIVIEAKDFSCPNAMVLADNYSHHSVDIAACCGGTGKGQVHREECSSEGKCFNIEKTRICTHYWNGSYFNYNPLESSEEKVMSYVKEYTMSNQKIKVYHLGHVTPYSLKTIEFIELFVSKYAAATVRVIDYDGAMSKIMSLLGMNVQQSSYIPLNTAIGADVCSSAIPDHVVLVDVQDLDKEKFPPLRERQLASVVIDRGKVIQSRECKDIDFLLSEGVFHTSRDTEGTLAITQGKKSFIRRGPSYFSVIGNKIVPQILLDKVEDYVGVLQPRSEITAAEYAKSSAVRVNRLHLYQKFHKLHLTAVPRMKERKWVLAGIGWKEN